MKKAVLSFGFASFASVGFSLSITLGTGFVKKPNIDGSYSDDGIRNAANVFMCLTDASTCQTYGVDSAAIYNAWQNGDFDSAEYKFSGTTGNSSIREYFIEDFPYDDYGDNQFYAIAVATYDAYDRSYYIARVVSKEYQGDDPDFDEFSIGQIISGADKWQVIGNEPLEIECTNIAVSGGTVTVTYQVSDISGFAVGSTVNFSVAYSLARNASGALATETLSGTINSIDATASTFTATLSPPANTTSLFILGIDD